ncbi:hypothetical protein HCZ97_07570 [Pseudooceanicola sp. HF7]|nr:hypothetical protein [Pseudooceanicola sp. HF7]
MHAHLSPPLIRDGLLAHLAAPDPDAQQGDFDAETRALLAVALPEICLELLQWRDAARTRPAALAMALRSQALEDQLTAARQAIQLATPHDASALASACDTLQRLSPFPDERDAAAQVLVELRQDRSTDAPHNNRRAQ